MPRWLSANALLAAATNRERNGTAVFRITISEINLKVSPQKRLQSCDNGFNEPYRLLRPEWSYADSQRTLIYGDAVWLLHVGVFCCHGLRLVENLIKTMASCGRNGEIPYPKRPFIIFKTATWRSIFRFVWDAAGLIKKHCGIT